MRGRRATRGFTMVELTLVLALVFILSGIATMRYIDLRNEAYSSSVAGDIQTVRLAAFNHYADTGGWPPTAPAGTAPAALVPLLPPAFSFDKGQYKLQWFTTGGGGGGDSGVGGGASTAEEQPMLAIIITSDNRTLMDKLAQRLNRGGLPFAYVGGQLIYFIAVPGVGV
ncbi:MAG: hypothetical protein NW201_07050 [Gemmatimonadales bacterium]|nr:hypothetical protein [Gemmatimonadales bacterium]